MPDANITIVSVRIVGILILLNVAMAINGIASITKHTKTRMK